jgi:hypothetical protein
VAWPTQRHKVGEVVVAVIVIAVVDLEFARLLTEGDIHLSDVADRDEEHEALAQIDVSEGTPDGRQITYHVAVGAGAPIVRWITEQRPFRYEEG